MNGDKQSDDQGRTLKILGWTFLLSGAALVILAFVLAKGEMPDWIGKSMTGPILIVMGIVSLVRMQVLSKRKTKEK